MLNVFIHANSKHNPCSFSLAKAYFQEFYPDVNVDSENIYINVVDDRDTKLVYASLDDDKDTVETYAVFYSTILGDKLELTARRVHHSGIKNTQISEWLARCVYHNCEMIMDMRTPSTSAFGFRRRLDDVTPRNNDKPNADICYDPPKYLMFYDFDNNLPRVMPGYVVHTELSFDRDIMMRVFKHTDSSNSKGVITANYSMLQWRQSGDFMNKVHEALLTESYPVHNTDNVEVQIDNVKEVLNVA